MTSSLSISAGDCEMVSAYVEVLCEVGSPDTLTQAKSLLSRIQPGLCPELVQSEASCPGGPENEG